MEQREQGASPRNEAPQDYRTGDASSADAIATPNYTTAVAPIIPQSLCPRCAFPGPYVPGPGIGPHHARLFCGQCGEFLHWLPRPRPVAQEERP